ncbi:hypothetical protein M9H77_02016 [Catharanthus roseus]|uniref:Uncharacterized protein n=1 Tax=Catharanthus roseus TaxID=4058 RepID=A0ACC0C7K9_CATRO|nr:hypothetical protein M9H77_02016 [Catharanthus roseus]
MNWDQRMLHDLFTSATSGDAPQYESFLFENEVGPSRFRGRPMVRWLKDMELHAAHTCITKLFRSSTIFTVENNVNKVTDPLLRTLSSGQAPKATSWPGYFVNGYNFGVVQHEIGKPTTNSGVWVEHQGSDIEFYGLLEDVVSIKYHGQHAIQVYYTKYLGMKRNQEDWMATCIKKSLRAIEVQWKEIDESIYQKEEMNVMPVVSTILDVFAYCDPSGVNLVIDFSEFALCTCPIDNESKHEDSSEDDDLDYSDDDEE